MKPMKSILPVVICAASTILMSSSVFAQETGRKVINFQGPGGHSYNAYGVTSAVHAAARSIENIQASLPLGSYTLLNFNGGNSVNSIAFDGRYEIVLKAANAADYAVLLANLTAAVKNGADAENAFRKVKAGDIVNGARVDIRYTIADATTP